jgi:site-specific DNA-methyltransferase (adenine-specific)
MPELTHAVDNGKLKVSTAVNLVKTGKDFTQAVLTKVQQDSATVKNAMKAVKEEQNAVLAKKIKTAKLDRYHLFHASCEVLLEQEAERFDWIITDPPYPKEFLPAFDLLGKVAAHTLKPGGSLLCMAGQSYLPAVMASLSTYLNYCWVLAYLTPGGQSVQIFPRKVNTFWKPVLWFVKGACNAKEWIGDVTRSDINDNDKRYHDWGQSESGMHDLVKRFVRPGHTILDPFVGAGTTGVAVLREGGLFTGYDIDKSAIDQSTVRLEKENEK